MIDGLECIPGNSLCVEWLQVNVIIACGKLIESNLAHCAVALYESLLGDTWWVRKIGGGSSR